MFLAMNILVFKLCGLFQTTGCCTRPSHGCHTHTILSSEEAYYLVYNKTNISKFSDSFVVFATMFVTRSRLCTELHCIYQSEQTVIRERQRALSHPVGVLPSPLPLAIQISTFKPV